MAKLSSLLIGLICLVAVLATVHAGTCGNWKIESGETCDDGNTVNGDGCSSACLIEAGWNCTGVGPFSCFRSGPFVQGCWTYMAGTNVTNAKGSYPALRAGTLNGYPGGRSLSAAWMDSDNNLFLYGGYGADRNGSMGASCHSFHQSVLLVLGLLFGYEPQKNNS
eukprot:TRINITY_DN196_c0_g1_i1.p1 TRINITY_DN196_c0_g1~~TRINITY_DN196_c0_g1_i1.p1  ORF type:complete len:165 (+),score=11.01 TRINITY_DN196_c0_g1_i1:192-686(+)